MKPLNWQTKWVVGTVTVLLVILEAQLMFSVNQNSQTFDESAHIYSGYSYWKTGDFGINPEHPPLEKLVDALPLLPTGIKAPQPLPFNFRGVSVIGGLQLLYNNDADALLLRARAMASLFTLACALLAFLTAYEMFGAGAGLIALLILVFEPNFLANGALVTTDIRRQLFCVRHRLRVLPVLKKADDATALHLLHCSGPGTGSQALNGTAVTNVRNPRRL